MYTTDQFGFPVDDAKDTSFKLQDFDVSNVQVRVSCYLGRVAVAASLRAPIVGDHPGLVEGERSPISLTRVYELGHWNSLDRKGRAKLVARAAVELLEHEVEEQLVIDDERPLYPHPGVPIPPVHVQYKPTRKEFRPLYSASQWASHTLYGEDYPYSGFADFGFRKLLNSTKPVGMSAKKLEEHAPAKPPRSRYMKPKGGFPNNELVTPKGRREMSAARR